MAKLKIKPLQTFKEYEACVAVQRQVWHHDDLDITPIHQFCVSVETGGILLGAFLGGKMVGYVYSFPAVLGGKHCQHSHHLAVLPEVQGLGLGKKLKWAQREEVLRREYDLITWTFDPMLTRNANLNLHALGAVAWAYVDNFYGYTPSLVLEAGVPTDRLLVEWWIRTRRVEQKRKQKNGGSNLRKIAAAVEQKSGGRYPDIFPARPNLSLDEKKILIELPRNIRDLKGRSGLVAAWQAAVRTALGHYFAAGYRAVDFICDERCFYVLKKERSIS